MLNIFFNIPPARCVENLRMRGNFGRGMPVGRKRGAVLPPSFAPPLYCEIGVFCPGEFSTALAGAFICRPILPALNRIFSKFLAEESIEVLNAFFIPIGEQPPCT